jgi:hypothetical protein
LLTAEIESNKGVKYAARADSIFHEEGDAEGVKSDIVMWYVGAYLRDLVIRLASLAAISGLIDLFGLDLISLDPEPATGET